MMIKADVVPFYADKERTEIIDYMVKCKCGMFVCYPTEYQAKENYKFCPRCGQEIYWEYEES